MLFVVIAVLSIVLFPCPVPQCHWLRGTVWLAPLVAAVSFLPPLVAGVWGRRALNLLDQHPEDPHPGHESFSRSMSVTHALLVVGNAILLLTTDWVPVCARFPVIGRWPVVPTLVALVPFVVSVLLIWIVTYPTERAIRQIALELSAFRNRPVRPTWQLSEFLIYNLRHQLLFVFVPVLLIVAVRDLLDEYLPLGRSGPYDELQDLILGSSSVAIAIFAPLLLRYIWTTRPLPPGPLRDKLERLCQKVRLRVREILVWRTGGVITNAAVMGVVGPLRYVLITDGMLEQMDDTKIEAVFGHEAGHAKRHHIFFFLMFALISGCLLKALSIYTDQGRAHAITLQFIVFPLFGLFMLFKWRVLFGWISRRFEWQADAYGVHTLALAGLPCSGPCHLHAPVDANMPRDPDAATAPLCATAAQVFGDTLNSVAILNGIPPDAASWRHGSIARRSRLVAKFANDPAAWFAFERSVAWIKRSILFAAIALSLWIGWELRVWQWVGINW